MDRATRRLATFYGSHLDEKITSIKRRLLVHSTTNNVYMIMLKVNYLPTIKKVVKGVRFVINYTARSRSSSDSMLTGQGIRFSSKTS